MSVGINECIFSGHLGRDPEGSTGGNGKKSRASFSLAVNKKYSTPEGETKENTTWVNCVAFDKTADFCYQYLKKGQLVTVVSEFQTRQYTGRDGSQKTASEFIVNKVVTQGVARPRQDEDTTPAPQQQPNYTREQDYIPPAGPPAARTTFPDKGPDRRSQEDLFDNYGAPIITDEDIPF